MTHLDWSANAPFVALAALFALPDSSCILTLADQDQIATVLVAVHHAEVVAHRIGEPFGTLALALSVAAIEVSLIVSLMIAGGGKDATVAWRVLSFVVSMVGLSSDRTNTIQSAILLVLFFAFLFLAVVP